MKYRMSLLVIIVLAALVVSCAPNLVSGSGNVVTRNENFTGFDSLDISYAFQATIRQGDSFAVAIRVDDNLVQYLDVRQTGTTVHIGFQQGTAINQGTMEVDITMPELVSLGLSGASRATISGFDSDKAVTMDLSGASSVQGDIRSGDMRVGASGASQVNLTGNAGNLNVEVSGASKFDGSSLTVRDARLNASGASTISVNASGRLDAEASGASHITYVGNPTMGSIETSGGSTINSK